MNTNTKRITNYITALISVVVLVCIDQFTKYLVVGHLKDYRSCDLVLQQSTYGKKISAASYLCGIDRWRSFR